MNTAPVSMVAVALSSAPEDIYKTDAKVKALHADAGYEQAIAMAKKFGLKLPML
ncbi:hypothetical protein [Serratia entomophila]|uniref:hypothetical protein n=1 Tax=Serratia entomophila TaxID=42906 RepID=UPI0021777373|nr:hypothetical protein [Serratia entomophila]CAI0737575.1 urocanate hydratase [Serratia entomophila]CAI0845054.1 urocanate hydratase [Serratia entomophila]CAI1548749.1 urocanate hydratase [Serratia entomophila]CAI1566289.1 urocanate hydratase [Serratia entomophila]CAI1594271.1 urocanate hydratase [Serratia entomophila]